MTLKCKAELPADRKPGQAGSKRKGAEYWYWWELEERGKKWEKQLAKDACFSFICIERSAEIREHALLVPTVMWLRHFL